MEAKEVRTSDQTVDTPVVDGYVSPDVAAAEAGEQVDFSKNIEDNPEDRQED